MELYFFSGDTFTESSTMYSVKMQTFNVLLELRDKSDGILLCSVEACCSASDNPIYNKL